LITQTITELYHGSEQIVKYPEIRIAKFNKDFYWGFYCTKSRSQAERWATRRGKDGVLNIYSCHPSNDLKLKRFPEMTDEWLDFIIACRRGIPHQYDIVEGPMADDQIFNFIQQYLDGAISREAFWALARFQHPTHQISFHTAAALATLHFVSSEKIRRKR